MVIHETERELIEQIGEGIRDVGKRILLGPKDGFSGYLRQFSLAPDGHTPFHSHDWYHAVYVLEGEGKLVLENEERDLHRGSVVFVEAQRKHNFVNTGASEMRFLCLVPEKGDSY
jgi:quercetin dioxygenase-like cupin family protein